MHGPQRGGWGAAGCSPQEANDAVGAQIGMGPGIAQAPSWTVVVLVGPLAVVVTAGLAVLAARRAATAEVAELVQYE